MTIMRSLTNYPCKYAAAATLAVLSIAAVSAAEPQQTSSAKTQAAGTTQTQNVNVVNTPTVAISGTPTVAIAGTPTVNVANPVTVAAAAMTPVHEFRYMAFNQNQNQSPSVTYTVPAGQRLVVESVTMNCFQQNGAVTGVQFAVNQPNGNITLAYMTPAPIVWTPGQPYVTGAETHALHAIVDAGSSLYFFASRGSVGDYGNCIGAFSGYLTPLP